MPPCRFEGKATKVLGFIDMMAKTWPIETDEEWWQVYLATKCWN